MLVNEIELDPLRKIPFKQGSKINWVGLTDVTLDTFWMYFGAYVHHVNIQIMLLLY